jgi:NADH:ubiquinone oxidoreductase subunit 6 (subunit J)
MLFLNLFNDYFNFFINSTFIVISIFSGIMVIVSRNPIHSIFFLILAFIGISCIMFFFNIEFLPVIFLVVYVGAVSVLFLFVVMMLNIKIIETHENFFNYLPVGIILGIMLFFELYLFCFKDLNYFYFDIKENISFYNYINELIINENKYYFEVNFLFNDDLIGFDLFDLNSYNYLNNQTFDYLNNFFKIEYLSYISEKDTLTDIEIIAQVIYQHKFYDFIISSLILLVAMVGAIVLTLTVKRDNFNIKRQNISEQVYRKIKLKIHNNYISKI